jgi:hypothetical protein
VDNPEEAADLLLAAGEFPNPDLVRGSMAAIVEGGYMRDAGGAVGRIDAELFDGMARFLFDSGVLSDAGGVALEWPEDVSDWYDQGWMTR